MRYLSFLPYLTLFLCSCLDASIYSDYDRNDNFNKYKTFAWSPEPHHPHKNGQYDNPIIENNIRTYVNKELEERGYRIDAKNPDVILDFDIMVEKKMETVTTPVYSNPNNYQGNYNYSRYNQYGGYGNNNGYSYNNGYSSNMQYQVGTRTQQIPYKEGTVTIDVIDRKTQQLVWKGWSESTLSDPESFSDELAKDIHAIFKRYPVAIPKKSNHAEALNNQ